MFFMMGITDGRKQLDFTQTVICGVCGKYGRYQVFMTYTVLSLFFIPCFKWNRHYYVQMSCCTTLYELDPEMGKAIARGEQVEFAAPGGSAGFLRRGYSFAPGQEVTLAIRGEQAQAVKGAEGPGLAGVVKEKSFAGGMLRIAVELAGGGEFICSRHGIDSELAPGDAVRVLWEPDKACPVDVPAGKGE